MPSLQSRIFYLCNHAENRYGLPSDESQSMPWQTLSLHFKQTYEGGYRYFDNCGEFMIWAVEKLNVISSEIKPTGAKMEIPERGVNATCDANSLVVVQELPLAGDESYFVNLCKEFADLANFHFEPTKIVRNGFLWKSYAFLLKC